MSGQLLATKLHIPAARSGTVVRRRLLERLDEGIHRRVTLVSAGAGFGKTTLISEWVRGSGRPIAWVSLDGRDSDPVRLLTHLLAATQKAANVGDGALALLELPQPPSAEVVLTELLNEISEQSTETILVLDDCHLVDSEAAIAALGFLIERAPEGLHLVVVTREDLPLPWARLRARGELTEIRAADLRFTPEEAASFLQGTMGLELSSAQIERLEGRTEGWIAGLQLAAISMQGRKDVGEFVEAFSGSHRFVLDYLLEEVLQRQPPRIQRFLFHTAVLERLCAQLCDAVTNEPGSQETLEALERANLFLVPLDDERQWYRFHHLFAELLRQRLEQSEERAQILELHERASRWFEANGLEVDAFRHAALAGDVDRAAALIEGGEMPVYYRGGAGPVVQWLESLPKSELDARPALWVALASALMFSGRQTAVEEKLRAAEAALEGSEAKGATRDLRGRIASMRATQAVMGQDPQEILTQAGTALANLRRDNLPLRTAATWALGYGLQLQGDRVQARQYFHEALALSQPTGTSIYTIAAELSLGQVHEAELELPKAAERYRRVLDLAGDPPMPIASEALLGLARIHYQWNELGASRDCAARCLELTTRAESLSTAGSCLLALAVLELARGDTPAALAHLDEAEEFARRNRFDALIPEINSARVRTLLHAGDVAAAARLASEYELPCSLARVHLARNRTSEAMLAIGGFHSPKNEMEKLERTIVETLVLAGAGNTDEAALLLGEALEKAGPGRIIRPFLDEGARMARLVYDAAKRSAPSPYLNDLVAAFQSEQAGGGSEGHLGATAPNQALDDPLTSRELEVLRLIAQGLSNREICDRLYRSLDTIKGHNRRIFGKLQVQRRTEAVARARELGLL